MLTSTYTLVALSVEQTTVHLALQSLLRTLHALPCEGDLLAPEPAARLCAALRQAVNDCHWRKLDKFLVPALRRTAAAADGLLSDLEQVSRTAHDALAAAEACVDAGRRGVDAVSFRAAVERCVDALRCRLEREEHELFPLARSLVRGEAWFAIANQMLAHDAVARERRATGRRGRLDDGESRPLRHALRGQPQGGNIGGDAPAPDYGRRPGTPSRLH